MHFRWLPSFTACALLACIARLACAQGVADPTRPPAVAAPASAARPASSAPAAAPLKLQSVQVPHGGRASALLGNRLVFIGDRVAAGTVTQIDAQGLELRDARGKTLRLPLIDAAVVKQTIAPPGVAAAPVASLGRRGTQP
jgi:hypothetical protein